MLTDQEKERLLHDRERAFTALDTGDYLTFKAMCLEVMGRLGTRLEEIRLEALLEHDATHYDDAARFSTTLSYGFHQRHRAYRGQPQREPIKGEAPRSAVVYPLPVLLEHIARGHVMTVEVTDAGVDTRTGEELLSVYLGLRPEAERALPNYNRRADTAIPWGLALRRALPHKSADELTRRLRRDPETPTRADIAELLHAVETYNVTHTTPIVVSTA